ncbi:MAG: GatB/YqeY domain-containing protein [Coriobacteriia bacterium]|nr:GatB/YqeY domain-containing protein [Coriobacteriia bacterium]
MNKEMLQAEIVQAMRDHDKPRLSILRMVKNEIEMREKDTKQVATGEDVVVALKKVLKQTGETLEGSQRAGTDAERTALLSAQVRILEDYLPEQVTGDALITIIDQVLAEHGFTERRDMGKAIGLVVAKTGGNCDKAEVARIIGSRLS